jgi:hypothetical protein
MDRNTAKSRHSEAPAVLRNIGLAVLEELHRPVIARGVLEAAREGRPVEWPDEAPLPDEAFWMLREAEGVAQTILDELGGERFHPSTAPSELLETVTGALAEAFGSSTLRQIAAGKTLVVRERQRILRGYLDTISSKPALTPQRTPVLYFSLLKVKDFGHLIRENHDSKGYHYHYSDDGLRRADVLLTFSRATAAPEVTWEPHAVKKADFPARVPRWRSKKRSSVRDVCLADLAKRKVADYVRPGKGAQFLIPPAATVVAAP